MVHTSRGVDERRDGGREEKSLKKGELLRLGRPAYLQDAERPRSPLLGHACQTLRNAIFTKESRDFGLPQIWI